MAEANKDQDAAPGAQSPEPRRLQRSVSERWLGGVCGGIAEYFGWDVTVVRILWLTSLFFGGVGLIAYIVCWFVIPAGDDAATPQPRSDRSNASLLWGIFLIVVGGFALLSQMDWLDFYPFDYYWHGFPYRFLHFRADWILPIGLIVLGAIYLARIRNQPNATEAGAGSSSQGDSDMDKKLTRSKDDRMIAGVCGGLARYFNIDPSLVRIGYVLLSLAGGGLIGVVVYIAMVIIVPEESDEQVATPAPAGQPEKPAAKTKEGGSTTTASRSKTTSTKRTGKTKPKGGTPKTSE